MILMTIPMPPSSESESETDSDEYDDETDDDDDNDFVLAPDVEDLQNVGDDDDDVSNEDTMTLLVYKNSTWSCQSFTTKKMHVV